MDPQTFALAAARFGLDLSLKVTFLLALVLLTLYGLRRLSASARHLVAMLGLAGALALPLATAVVPSFSIPLVPRLLPADAVDADDTALPPSESAVEMPVAAEAASGVPAAETRFKEPAPAPATPPWTPQSIARLLIAAWLAGAILSLARLAFGFRRVRRIADDGRLVGDAAWTDAADELARRLGISRAIRLVASADVPVAMTSGIRRPVLLVNDAARKWSPERRRVVLLHELAHVRRGDWLTLVVAELAAAVYWFHPLVYLARREARRSCERACDDLVLDHGTKPSVYAAHLLGIVRSLKPATARALPVMAMARPSQFEGRMRAILDPGLHRRGPTRAEMRGAALGVLFAVLVLSAVQPWSDRSASAAALPAGADQVASLWTPADVRSGGSTKHQKPFCPKERGRESIRSASPNPVPAAPEAASDAGFVLASKWKSGKVRLESCDSYERGMRLHRRERFDEAIEAFQKSIDAGCREEAASYNIACGYALKGDKDRAFEWLAKAEAAGFELEKYLESDDDLDDLRSDPRFAALQHESKDRKMAAKRDAAREAAARYERLASQETKDGNAFYESALHLLKNGDYALSAKAFHRSAELGNRPGTSFYNEACALSLAGETGPALDALRRSLENGFDNPSHLADDDDLEAIRKDPRFPELQTLAEELQTPSVEIWKKWLRSTNRPAWREAVEHARKAALRHPTLGRAWFNLGYAQIRGEQPDAAVVSFRKALDLGYRRSASLYNLACSYARLDQKDAAFDVLFQSLAAGFGEEETLRQDRDLDNLRRDPRFRKAQQMIDAREDREVAEN
ncbi:MAG: M56 family metallopeptidase [Acidobacteriota bacterium]